jgi:hypothetical protein
MLGPADLQDQYFSVTVTSFLTAPGYTITKVTGEDPANTGIGSLCAPRGCDPSQLQRGFEIIGFPPNGSMFVNGQQFGMWGFPGFLTISVNSFVDADGSLWVFGDAVGYGTLKECDVSGQCLPIPDSVCFDFGKTSWQYSGQFIPNPNNEGTYDLSFITIQSKHPVKLPASGN